MNAVAAFALIGILVWALGMRVLGHKEGKRVPLLFALIVGILAIVRFVDRLMFDRWRRANRP